ncbi:hypothetical protein RhiirA1_469982 [Rhizophagus irregularis]|uniref:Uncharacterized protein n=1 Tax=Rhizophagus irregularis TaxID=588596 RepID=A0A2N0R6X5_9GLOM|nr:hypothetical protein RhiirA1_469982 [Rhizophagus irregularis]
MKALLKSKSAGYEKTIWERIETELEKVNVESLGFDHPICSRVLDKPWHLLTMDIWKILYAN